MRAQKTEELLETIFTERESGRDDPVSILAHTNERHAEGKCTADFAELEREGLVCVAGDRISLTPAGDTRAAFVVRRHRLAERLFTDLLDLPPDQVEQQACELEHVLSAGATDSVCTLLGHPDLCPHGKQVPRGACCSRSEIAPPVIPLSQLPDGARARVAFLVSRAPGRVSRLLPFGIAPGSELRLRQHAPAFVIEVGETTLALEASVAREVFVQPL